MITDLIPQRDPILMVDDAQATANGVKATLMVRESNWFYMDGILLEAGLVEHIAQSAAAMVGLKADGDPHEGYIGDVKDFTVLRLPLLNETIETLVNPVVQMDNITLIEAESYVNGKMVAKARLKVFIVD